MKEFSLYPHRKCINCDTVKVCPGIVIEQDGFGTITLDPECPKRKERENELNLMKNERAHR